jgi:hypothetical protein
VFLTNPSISLPADTYSHGGVGWWFTEITFISYHRCLLRQKLRPTMAIHVLSSTLQRLQRAEEWNEKTKSTALAHTS